MVKHGANRLAPLIAIKEPLNAPNWTFIGYSKSTTMSKYGTNRFAPLIAEDILVELKDLLCITLAGV